ADGEAESDADGTPSQERLDDLQGDIDRVRARVEDEAGESGAQPAETDTDREFIESGEEEPVDDTIAPPG
ncbi:MAG: hypothetical protein KY454_14215, partial [Actinobacteria bacterium]|nr:hypothetical protein [Actinomycetota bacterium]